MEECISNIESMEIADLEALVNKFPWFGYARQALFMKLAENGCEFAGEQLKKCSAFLPLRHKIYYKAVNCANEETFPVIDFNEINKNIDFSDSAVEKEKSVSDNNAPRYIIIGGDYFTKEDLDSLEQVQAFDIGKLGSAKDESAEEYADIQRDVNNDIEDESDIFYTETLASIYAEQGYYEEAMKVYAKLILLYPEKSAYFATLVNKIKSKNN